MDIYTIRNQLSHGKTIFDLPLRVTYYARVSTDKDEQLHSLSAQIQYYSEFIRKNPNWTFAEGYIDEGISGTSVGKRESFLQMIQDARAGKFDFIVTKEISRFSRSTLDSITYTQELLSCGVGVLFQSDNINTLLPDAELRLTIMSSIAQDEVRKISERVRFGFKRAVEKGVVLGNNRIWGYEKDNGKLVINEEEAQIIRLIFDLYANQLMGIRRIANHLTDHGYTNMKGNDFSYSSITGILRNPKYKGYYCGGKTVKYDYKIKDRKELPEEEWVMYRDEESVPPIVSEELWEKANRILRQRSNAQRSEDKNCYQNRYTYSGKVICSEHQAPFYRQIYRYPSGDREVWQCREYTRHGRSGCKTPVIYKTELDDMLRQALIHLPVHGSEIIRDMLRIYCAVSTEDSGRAEKELNACRIAMDNIARRKDRLLDLNIGGRISDEEFSARNERFNRELERLNERNSRLQTEIKERQKPPLSMDVLQRAIEQECSFPDGFSAGAVDSMVDRIVIHPTPEKGIIRAELFLKESGGRAEYEIRRSRGNTSICYKPYT